ncbi:MAG: hypothetical protein JNL63_06040 [Bacteroidia bacterium]|nr:hypothetical protein [Bacteroidia bacterium]
MKTTLIIVLISATMWTSGCKKKEETTSGGSAEALSSSVIKGKVYADLNTTIAGNEDVTSLCTIIAKVSTADLYTPSPAVPRDRFYSTSVKSDGTYSISVEAGAKPVSVTVYPQDFETDQIISTGPTTTQRKIYTKSSFSVTSIQGGVKIIDITYN